ncbi:MAG: hypothetical protein AB2L18_01400 [Anaerolineaceae bacterium]
MFFGSGSVSSKPVSSPVTDPDIPLEQQNLVILEQTQIPENDVYATAAKYKHINIDPNKPAHEKIAYAIGDTREFYVLDTITNEYKAVNAALVYSTAHLYFWIEGAVQYELEDVEALCEAFEGQIYPLNREFFGSESTPGIDSDEHLFVLYTSEINGATGYFSSADMYPQEIEPYSNEAEIIMLSSLSARLDEDYTYGVLAHEFQHMIHQNLDQNESTWINEGFAELAMLLNGYDPGGTDWLYARNPDIQLNFWPRDEVESTLPHYGASYIFMTYLYDRFGEEFSRKLVADPLNDFSSIDAVLAEMLPKSDKPVLTGDDVFQDWTIANLLQDSSLGNGEFGYQSIPDLSNFRVDGSIDCTSTIENPFSVHQYGVDYFDVDCDHPFSLQFTGQQTIPVVPEDPHSGDYYFWSNKGDQSALTLTHTFDFSNVEGPIILKYFTWYDLETDWDYVYLLASEDGENWDALKPAHCTEENITGSNQGCGYNGASGGWIQEEVDLTQYAGKTITLQFEYLTDAALNGEGFLLDDVSIENIGYKTDFEEDDGGWIANGFVRIVNVLPQSYRVTVVRRSVDNTFITRFTVPGDEPLKLDFSATTNEEVYLIVSGTARYTEMPASYSFEIQE